MLCRSTLCRQEHVKNKGFQTWEVNSHDRLEGVSSCTPPIVMVQTMCRQAQERLTCHTASITVARSDLGYTWKHSHMVWKEKKKSKRRRKWGPDSSMLTWQSFSLTVSSPMNLPDTSVHLGTYWRNWLGRCGPQKGHDTERHCSRQWHSSWCSQNCDRRRRRMRKDILVNGVRQRRFPRGEIFDLWNIQM